VEQTNNEYFVKHPSNHQLAKFMIDTKAKAPEELCSEILQLVGEECNL
jgi:hypothetical protein